MKKILTAIFAVVLLAGTAAIGMWYMDKRASAHEITMIQLPYDEVEPFRNGLALVRSSDTVGVINPDGVEVIPLEYPLTSEIEYNSGSIILDGDWIYLSKDGKSSVADLQGHIIFTVECESIIDHYEGIFRARKDENMVFINMEGETVGSYDYRYKTYYTGGYAIVQKNSKHGLIDKEGRIIIPLEYDSLGFYAEGLIRATKDGHSILINPSDNTTSILPDTPPPPQPYLRESDQVKYYKFHGKDPGYTYWELQRDSKLGIYDYEKYTIVLEPEYTSISLLKDNLAIVQKYGSNDKWGIISLHTGRMIVPLQYDAVRGSIATEGPIAVREGGQDGGKWGYVDTTSGALVIPLELKYDNAEGFREGLARVKKDGKYGFIDTQGKLVIPTKYDEAEEFKNGQSLVKIDGKYYFINIKGKKTTLIEFDEVIPLDKEDSWIADRNKAGKTYYDDPEHYGSLGGNAIARSGTTWYILKKQ